MEPLGLSPSRVLALGPHLGRRGIPAIPLGRYRIRPNVPPERARELVLATRAEVIRELAPALLEAYLDTIAGDPLSYDGDDRARTELLLGASIAALRAAQLARGRERDASGILATLAAAVPELADLRSADLARALAEVRAIPRTPFLVDAPDALDDDADPSELIARYPALATIDPVWAVRSLIRDAPLDPSMIEAMASGAAPETLRSDPGRYAIEVAAGATPRARIGERAFRFPQGGREIVPSVVGTTAAVFEVELEPERIRARLRLPHGARYAILSTGELHGRTTDSGRRRETTARLSECALVLGPEGARLAESPNAVGLIQPGAALESLASALARGFELEAVHAEALADAYVLGTALADEALGRRFGVLLELGADNLSVTSQGAIVSGYIDACCFYRHLYQRLAFGFFSGAYGSAAALILATARPLPREEVARAWSAPLEPAPARRRRLLRAALEARCDPDHAIHRAIPTDARTIVLRGLALEHAQIVEWERLGGAQ
jgi:hypothetical protein